MLVCAKKDGTPRRTVDLQALNKYGISETHHTQSSFHQARSVPHNKKKTVFDAWNGYHSVPLHPDDRHLTTFITPWGHYRYCVVPQGYVTSGDAYTRRYDNIVVHIPNKTKCVEDTLLWTDTVEESFWQAVNWLDVSGRKGIILNPVSIRRCYLLCMLLIKVWTQFWLELSLLYFGPASLLQALRYELDVITAIALPHPNPVLHPPISPAYPFQCVCADFFHNGRVYYLVVVDRYSNWPIVEVATSGTQGLISCLRLVFVTYGISNELTSDGGPEFTATVTCQFLKDWGVSHRLSSVTFPHSNCRAEVGMKTVKRILMNNTGPRGSLDTDAFQWAMLQYRNTPDCETKLSPAECVFGRPIRDLIPIHPGRYTPTVPGGKHWKHARKPWGTDTCRMLNDGLNTLVAYLILLLVTMSVYRIKLAPILENGTKLGVS